MDSGSRPRDKDERKKSKKRHRHDDDSGKRHKRKKEKVEIMDAEDDEELWVEKNIDMDGERASLLDGWITSCSCYF